MNQFLDRSAIHADDFVPAVDQRIGRHRGLERSLVRHDLQPRDGLVRQPENLAGNLGLVLAEGHLAEARGRCPFLALADLPGNLTPLQALRDLGGNDHLRYFIAAGNHGWFLG